MKKIKQRIPGISIFVNEGDTFKLGDSMCRVIEVSGHTLGHICYYFSKRKSNFCGDTLFLWVVEDYLKEHQISWLNHY